MKKLLLLAVFAASCKTYIQPSTAHADYDCGPTICSRQWFCGRSDLPAYAQRCQYPAASRYCETRVCGAFGTYFRWTWWTL
jgi:hypothetical protein